MSRLPRLAVLMISLSLATAAMAGPQEDERARQAVRVLTDIQQIPEAGIPDKLLDEARGIVVVPDALKDVPAPIAVAFCLPVSGCCVVFCWVLLFVLSSAAAAPETPSASAIAPATSARSKMRCFMSTSCA